MKFKVLKNPKTDNYRKFKFLVLSREFPWFYYENIYPKNRGQSADSDIQLASHATQAKLQIKELGLDPRIIPNKNDVSDYRDSPFFSHSFLIRPTPEKKYPSVDSAFLGAFEKVLYEIVDYNNIKINCIFRINANLLYPSKGKQKTLPHIDHTWEHKMILIYLTDAGGETICVDDKLREKLIHDPSEDGVVEFDTNCRLHYCKLPKKDRRIIIVVTYI